MLIISIHLDIAPPIKDFQEQHLSNLDLLS